MEITGIAEFIKRIKQPAPKDGVHVNGRDGFLKGCHAIRLHEELVPKGRVKMYVRKTPRVGVAVFYSLAWKKAQKLQYVKRMFRKWKRLYDVGVAPKPLKIVQVDVNLLFKRVRHKAKAYAIKTEHIPAPEKAWNDYMRGIPYDWNADSHPDHSPEGYRKFVKWAKRTQVKHGIKTFGSYKIGDVMWHSRKKRWLLCDID